MAFKHGVYAQEQPTALSVPIQTLAGLPVIFGAAPVNLVENPSVNELVLCHTFEEAAKVFGYSKVWSKYGICEFMDCYFKQFNLSPVIFCNVLDPFRHCELINPIYIDIVAGKGFINDKDLFLETITVKARPEDIVPFTRNVDYTLAFDSENCIILTVLPGGTIPPAQTSLYIQGIRIVASKIEASDVIGGIDQNTGKVTGLELLEQVFPKFGLVPGFPYCPNFMENPTVTTAVIKKAENINGVFKAMTCGDIPTDINKKAEDTFQWKKRHNYTSELLIPVWPMLKNQSNVYHQGSQLIGLFNKLVTQNDNIPYQSASNNKYQATGTCLKDGTEVILEIRTANALNEKGIVTALNFNNGLKSWGNYTGAYPDNTDPKDIWYCVKMMSCWLSNNIILSFWDKIDKPITRRLIDSIIDTQNIYLNGLVARQFLLGGRVEFVKSENPLNSLLSGKLTFHLYATPPIPAQEIFWLLEFDPNYLNTLFETR